jgi:hypothetical protein
MYKTLAKEFTPSGDYNKFSHITDQKLVVIVKESEGP